MIESFELLLPIAEDVELLKRFQGRKTSRGLLILRDDLIRFAKLRLAKVRGVRWEYLYAHLKETEWRFNHRRDNLFKLLIINLGSSRLI